MRFLPLVVTFLATFAALAWNAWADYRDRTESFQDKS